MSNQTLFNRLRCWLGHHKDTLREDRRVQRWTAPDGEHEDIKAVVECRCGNVTKTDTHSHVTHSEANYQAGGCSRRAGRNTGARMNPGDVLNFRVQPGRLLAGMAGVCRIDSFEQSRAGAVVYIDTQQSDGSWVKRFARFAPGEIAFAPVDSTEFAIYTGEYRA